MHVLSYIWLFLEDNVQSTLSAAFSADILSFTLYSAVFGGQHA